MAGAPMKAFAMKPSLAMKKPKYAVWDDNGTIVIISLKESLVVGDGFLITGRDLLLNDHTYHKYLVKDGTPICFTTDKLEAKRYALQLLDKYQDDKIKAVNNYVAGRRERIQNLR